jgi:error-prone DNA polymerase
MGWRNPPVPWSQIERRLSDRPAPTGTEDPDGPPGGHPDGGDPHRPGAPTVGAPWPPVERVPATGPPRPTGPRPVVTVPYAELHCHSNFSFLDGASPPEELVAEAAHRGLEALAITDHDSFAGAVRFAEAARAHGLPTVFGAELTLDLPPCDPVGRARPRPDPVPDPPGRHLVVLARDPVGYARLATAISDAQLRGRKSHPSATLDQLAEAARRRGVGGERGVGGDDGENHWLVLTGCRKGTVPAALVAEGPGAAERELWGLVERFGARNVAVELWDHGDPLDSARNDALVRIAAAVGVEVVATNNVHYATMARRRLATALAAVRARRSLDDMDGWLPAGAGAPLRSGDEQARRFARYPGVVERAAELGRACAFDLSLVAPRLPPFPCPAGHTEMSWLRRLVAAGAAQRYGPPASERVAGAYAQIDHELAVIEQLGFPGYFLVVWDIVQFCRTHDIYCQGRGSAANSAVCYALGVTNADAVALGLLFERFLSPERDGPPDIDLDIESGRREEVIQYVYERHGRRHAAQVANVITYRARSAVRDMARALGYSAGQQDAFARRVDRWRGLHPEGPLPSPNVLTAPSAPTTASATPTAGPSVPDPRGPGAEPGADPDDLPADVLELARQVEHFPRHLGIHSGGMVVCDRPVVEVCPVEWASMEGRTVLQWDKDDCAAVGLVKFDLLGLGMLSALHRAVDLIAEHHGVDVDLATIPQEDAVYDMLCAADSIGVFQVESRAQMATLPRLRPRTFYDLVVEVALIRPGPIQGGSVHPYIRRRNGEEPVTYLHPLLEPALAKTLGVPLFQEQLMQMAIDVAGFSAGEADQLRQAMGSKRSRERMERLRARLYAGMAERGVTGEVADRIWDKLAAFANFGFPESHSVSFAYLVYSSSWIKLHYPAAFCAALLDAQPMGFYSPHTLVQDARRHGVEVRTPDMNRSGAGATLETVPGAGPALRLGLSSVRHLGDEVAEAVVAEREAAGPYRDMEDVKRRAGLGLDALEALATAGAFGCFEGSDGSALGRRAALWGAGAVAQTDDEHLAGIVTGAIAPMLPGMDDAAVAAADLWATGVAPGGHPTRFLRDDLAARGVVTAAALRSLPDGDKVRVAGVVTHRQRPATAGGTTFVNLEDETGLVNVVVSVGCWLRHRAVARDAPALVVRGRLERVGDVVNVAAERLEPLELGVAAGGSRDFR